ncbi:MAG: flagellin [Deltaproteobacteria bacterium]|nr:flagellin [Deltaproteobacteria bacterium]
MGLRIQHNTAALNAHRHLTISDAGLSKSLERLSSGYRINRAADDAAGLAISEQFRADIASYRVCSRNVSEANSLLQVAEGAMDQIAAMLTRMKELATQAASANAGSNVAKLEAENAALKEEINRIANSTEYAGSKLINGTFGVAVSAGTLNSTAGLSSVTGLESDTTYTVASVTSGAGIVDITISATLAGGRVSQTVYDVTSPATANDTTTVSFDALGLTITFNNNLTSASDGTIISTTATASDFQVGVKNVDANDRIGILLEGVTTADLSLDGTSLSTAAGAQSALTTIDTAISTLASRRGTIGAAQNRLNYAAANISITVENVTAAESVIRDVDMAAEMTTFTKNQILLQAGTAMLAQANMAPQSVLSLFG